MTQPPKRHDGPAAFPAATERTIESNAKVIAAWTLVSRVTGLARDILVNARFGQGWVQDAFNYGFQIPNLFRRLFGEGALSAALVPTFTEVLHRDGRPAAWALLSRVLGRMTVVLCGATMLVELVLLAVWRLQPAGAITAHGRLVICLTAIMTPFMISICIVALFSSLLNCLGHFSGPAAMPIVLNICMIAGIEWIGPWFGSRPEQQVYGVALSVLVTGALQLILMRPMLRRAGVPARPAWGTRDGALKMIERAFVPAMLGQGVFLIGAFVDSQLCTSLSRGPDDPATFTLLGTTVRYPLESGALSAMTNAQRLYQFPLGVLAISLATAALPMFSRYAVAGDRDGLRGALSRAMRLAVFEGLPCGLMLVVLAEPIVALLFQHGQYTPDHTLRAAGVLRWYGVGVWAFCAQHVVLRGFYSIKDTRTPMWIGSGMVALNTLLSATLLWHSAIRERAFGISMVVTSTLNIVISMLLLRQRLGGRLGARSVLLSMAGSLAASLAAAATAVALRPLVVHAGDWLAAHLEFLGATLVRRTTAVMLPLLAAIAVFLICARLLRMPELGWVLRKSSITAATNESVAGTRP